jgi:hypothetical protein
MNWTAAFQLASAIVVSLGGGAGIVFGLSNFLAKIWADRALEKEKHKYADMLQNAKSELERTTNRYQVQLDALSHIHQLRTDEEFSRLGQLWKRMAVLQDGFKLATGLGLKIVPSDAEEYKKYQNQVRSEYEKSLFEARSFYLEEKLFIPDAIAQLAEVVLSYPVKEKNTHDLWANDREPTVRMMYTQGLASLHSGFAQGMDDLEKLMREHIQSRQHDSEVEQK